MLRRTVTTGLALFAFTALTVGAPAKSEAQLIPSLWNSIFGPSWYYTGYYGTGYYGPSYTTVGYSPTVYSASYLDTTSFYAPSYSTSFYAGLGSACCAPTCCPQTACSPCGVGGCSPCVGGNCPGGVCGANYGGCDAGLDAQSGSNGRLQPTPDGNRNIPRTYDPAATNPMGTTNPPPAGTTSPFGDRDEGFRPRNEPAPMTDPSRTESYRFESPEAETIPQRTNSADGEQPEDATRETGDELRLPPIDLDDKVTWRTVPERTRLNVRSTFKAPTVARAKVDPNRNWKPVSAGTKLVKK